MRRTLRLLAAACLSVLAAPLQAGEQDAAALIEKARAAGANGDTRALVQLAAADPTATASAVEKLLSSFEAPSATLAAALARAYQQAWQDDTLNDRVALYASWTSQQRTLREEAMQLNLAAKTASDEGRQHEALADYEKALLIFRQLGDRRMEGRCLLNMSGAEALLGESQSALSRLAQASEVADRCRDQVAQVAIAINRGYALEDLGDFETERTVLTEGLAIARAIDDRSGEGMLLTSLTSLSLNLSRLDDAEAYAKESLRLGDELGDAGISWAAWTNLSSLHESRNQLARSEQDARQALQAARQGRLPVEEASAAFNLANRSLKRGAFAQAREWLAAARSAIAPTDAANIKGKIEVAEAAILILEGRYQETLPFLNIAQQRFGDLDVPAIEAEFDGIRAHATYYLGDYDGAISWARRALAAAVRASRADIEANCRESLSRILWVLGDTAAALEEKESARRIYAERGATEDVARMLASIGSLKMSAGDRAGARSSLEQALELVQGADAGPQRANVQAQLADLELTSAPDRRTRGLELLREATRFYQGTEDLQGVSLTGLIMAEDALKAGDLATARGALAMIRRVAHGRPNTEFDWQTTYYEGRVQQASGDLKAARDSYRRSIEAVEWLRGGVTPVSWRAAILEDRIAPYRAMVRLLGDLGQVDQSWQVARSAKARTFVERLQLPDFDDAYASRRETSATASMRPGPTMPSSRLRSFLAQGEALVDFFAHDQDLMVFVVTHDRAVVRRLKLEASLLESIRYPGLPGAAQATVTEGWRSSAQRLGWSLFAPIAREIAGARHLLIVPGGPLNGIPFAALEVDGQPLVETRVVSILPAAESLLSRRRPQSPFGHRAILAMGDPVPPDASGRLPGAGEEARTIASLALGAGARAETLIGEAAREADLRTRAPAFDRIHLAAHGRIDRLAPGKSYIALSAGAGQDGRLEASEISAMNLDASLVVLSGCGTAIEGGLASEPAPGEERIGLARAFLSAGAGNVLADLWEMEDRASLAIMPALYPRLDGSTPAEALARLQRDLIAGRIRDASGRALDHPFYWAGLVAYGAGRR